MRSEKTDSSRGCELHVRHFVLAISFCGYGLHCDLTRGNDSCHIWKSRLTYAETHWSVNTHAYVNVTRIYTRSTVDPYQKENPARHGRPRDSNVTVSWARYIVVPVLLCSRSPATVKSTPSLLRALLFMTLSTENALPTKFAQTETPESSVQIHMGTNFLCESKFVLQDPGNVSFSFCWISGG